MIIDGPVSVTFILSSSNITAKILFQLNGVQSKFILVANPNTTEAPDYFREDVAGVNSSRRSEELTEIIAGLINIIDNSVGSITFYTSAGIKVPGEGSTVLFRRLLVRARELNTQ